MTLLEGLQELGDVAINIQKFRVLGGFCCHPDQKNRGNPHCWSEDPKYWNGGWKEVPRRVQQNFKSTMYYVLLAVATQIVMPLFSPTYEISHEHTGRNEITSRTLKAKVFGKCSSHNSILYDTESSTEGCGNECWLQKSSLRITQQHTSESPLWSQRRAANENICLLRRINSEVWQFL